MTDLCSDDQIQILLTDVQSGATGAANRIAALLETFRDDPRLHFLLGSVLVGDGKHIAAHASLQRAVELAPDFNIARFQLGFFELTSGEADAAIRTLGPLRNLPETDYLHWFVRGLHDLVADRFSDAVACLQRGIELNNENLPLSRDMNLIIEECLPIMRSLDETEADTSVSATSFVLNQFGTRGGLQ